MKTKISLRFIRCILILAVTILLLPNGRTMAAPEDAIMPGQIRADATFTSIGVVWTITSGDTNHNSSMKLEYRQSGEGTWHAGAAATRAYPTILVDGSPLGLNYWAASAMFLQPGQPYELRLTLSDPEGGSAVQTVMKTTRSELTLDPAGRQLYVIPGSGGGDGSSANPFKGLQAAADQAKPGDRFSVAAGHYQPFQLLTSGTAGHPIAFIGPYSGQAIIDGAATDRGIVTLGESDQTLAFVILRGFVIQNGAWGIDAQNTQDILISSNTITNVDNGILNRRENNLERNQTIRDNIILGKTTWPQGNLIPEEEGIDLRGSGNVVANNRLRNFGDCISVNPFTGDSYGNDVYGNDIAYCVDDGIEIDANEANARVWRNRVMDSRMGVSVQPIRGGPAYIFRNEFFNLQSDPIKMHNETTGYWVIHNTSVMNGNGQSDDGDMWRNATFQDNLILGTFYAFEFTTAPDEGFRDFDYNAWGTTRGPCSASNPNFKWNNTRYNCLADMQKAGVEIHGLTALYSHLTNPTLPASWDIAVDPGSRDLRLKAGSPEINAGMPVANLDDPFVSDGHPDLGAFELGQLLPIYGPFTPAPNHLQVFLPLVKR